MLAHFFATFDHGALLWAVLAGSLTGALALASILANGSRDRW